MCTIYCTAPITDFCNAIPVYYRPASSDATTTDSDNGATTTGSNAYTTSIVPEVGSVACYTRMCPESSQSTVIMYIYEESHKLLSQPGQSCRQPYLPSQVTVYPPSLERARERHLPTVDFLGMCRRLRIQALLPRACVFRAPGPRDREAGPHNPAKMHPPFKSTLNSSSWSVRKTLEQNSALR